MSSTKHLFRQIFYPVLFLGFISCSDNKESKTILAVVAHPDDETAIGAVLAKHAVTDNVYLLIATDGRYGTTKHAGIPAGDSLAKIREAEAICSCEKLGIEPPIFLKFRDGLGIAEGLGEYFEQTTQLKIALREKIKEIDPDFIITFGPDGDTGHPDHRAIGDLVTEIILREGWLEKYPLYFMGWSKDDINEHEADFLNYVDPKYLNVRITFGDQDEQKLFESIRCHKSQFSSNDAEEWIKREQENTSNTFYFRQLNVDTKLRTDF